MTCRPNQIAVIAGCINGNEPVSIHYEYTLNEDGAVSGLRQAMITNGAGIPRPLGPGESVSPGCCPDPINTSDSDFETVHYDDTSLGGRCRRIILIHSDTVPPTFTGFELNTDPVNGFDPNLIVEKCPCLGNVPLIPWP